MGRARERDEAAARDRARGRRGRARSGSCGRARPRRSASGGRAGGRAGRWRSTRWPWRSMTARSVCTNASRAPGFSSGRSARATACSWTPSDDPRSRSRAPARSSAPVTRAVRRRARSARSAPGSAAVRSSGLTSSPRPPLETSASRSTRPGTARRTPSRSPPPSECPTIVARSMPSADSRSRMTRRVRAERVVAARRGRVAVADQVGRDHRVALGEPLGHRCPVPRRVDHPVDEHHRRPGAGHAVDDLMAVELDLPGVEHGRAQT